MAQSPDQGSGTSEIIRYDLGWNAINAMLRSGRSLSGHERNCCFLNLNGTRFANVSAASSLDFADDGRVLALSDWDYDGDVDFWVANRSGPQVRFLRNNSNEGFHRVAFLLEGRKCNRDAIGARIVLRWRDDDGRVMTQTVRSSDSYLSQSSKWISFGLGNKASIDLVLVHWPNGETQRFKDVAVDRWYRLAEGDPRLSEWTPPSFAPLAPEKWDAPPLSDKARIVLLAPIPLPDLEYSDREGRVDSAVEGVTNARLINLWATWCNPCLEELSKWSKHAAEFDQQGLEVITVNADEVTTENADEVIQAATATLQKLGVPFTQRFATNQFAERLDVIQRSLLSRQRPLPLPSSFLLDGDGNLRVVYKGPVSPETLLNDLELITNDAGPEEVLSRAMPFAGRWLTPPAGSTPLQVAVKLIEGNFQDEALGYLRSIFADETTRTKYGSASLLNLMGGLLIDRREFQSAARCFQQSLQLDANNRTAHIELGTLLLAIRKGAAAEPHFRHVLRATPSDTELNYKLGIALMYQQKDADAIRQFEAVAAARPHAMANWQLAELYLRGKSIAKSMQYYEQAIAIDESLVSSANNLAWLLATIDAPELRDAKRAVEIAKLICQSAEKPSANQLDTLAAAYASAGDFAIAIETGKRALSAAEQQANQPLVQQIRTHLQSYERKSALRETP